MSLVVNTNVSSLTAQRGLAESGDMLDKAMARLSSGSRINSASDDAAGLAIVQRMSAQINGLNMAVKNANDGISLTQSIEGALVEVVDMLQRVRELAVQSANDTNTNTDRAFLQEEVTLLINEISRVSANTRFNQTTVLDGSFTNKQLQVGTEGGETIQFSVDSVSADALGAYKVKGDRIEAIAGTGANANGTGADDSIIINGNSLSKAIDVTAGDSAQNVAANINKVSGETGVTATAKTYAHYYSRSAADETTKLLINGTSTNNFVISGTNVTDAVDKINSISGTTGVSATATSDYKVLLYASSGKDVTIENETSSIYGRVKAVSHDGTSVTARNGTAGVLTFTQGGLTASTEYFLNNTTTGQTWAFTTSGTVTAAGIQTVIDAAVGSGKITMGGANNGAAVTASFTGADDFGAFTVSATLGGNNVANLAGTAGVIDTTDLNLLAAGGNRNDTATIQGSIDLSSSKLFSVTQSGTDANDDYFTTGAGKLTTVSNVDLRNQAGASNAISVLDGAIEKISSMRADLGAIENRLSYTVSNLMNISENTAEARSRINDADYSVESANLAKAQVLQQAGTAMLSQANARAQLVLQLLQ